MKKALIVLSLILSAAATFAQSLPNVAFPTSEPSPDVYTVNISGYGAAYNDKVALIAFRTPNSGPATLNITPVGGSALGARPLRKLSGGEWVPLASGDIVGDSSLFIVHYSAACGCIRIHPQGTGSGGGGVTPVDGSGLTWSIDRYNLGGTLTGNVSLTTGSNNFMVNNDDASIVFNGGGGTFTYNGGVGNPQFSLTPTEGLSYTGPIRIVNLAGTGDRMVMADVDGDLSTVLDPRKLPALAKTASFQAAIAEAGVYKYNITPGSATTITFPSMSGQNGLQWVFWKNPDADDVVFDFGAVTSNGANHLPDSTLVYVTYDGVSNAFQVAGTNPATGGGGSGAVESVAAGNLIDVDATDPANPVVSVETGDKGDITIGSNTLTIDNSAVTNAKINDVALGKITGFGTGVATALAVNTGSAGALVLFNGVLGTPSSGTATNLTGLPLTTGVTGVLPAANGGTGINNSTRTLTIGANSGTVSFTNAASTLTVAATSSVSGTNTGDQTITLSGDITGSGTGAITTDLSDTGVGAGSYRTLTVDIEGRATAGSNQEVQSFDTKTANYTFVLGDADKKTILMNVATANTLTVPTNASVPFPIGTIINFMRIGAGPTTITPADGSVLITSSSGSLVDPGANIECTIKKTGTNTWTLQNGLPSSTVIFGTYTPTLTGVANVDASTAYTLGYYRVGNMVTVFGRVDLDPTTTATDTQLGISLPIASNFTSANQAGGAAPSNTTAQGGAILSDATNDRLVLQLLCNGTANAAFYFTCSYQVL